MRVVIAYDRPSSMALARWLEPLDDVEPVGVAGDLDELVRLLLSERPGIAVVGLDVPGLDDDRDVVAHLREVVPDLKVVVVSERTTDAAVVRAFRSGADAFVVERECRETLPWAVSSVARGGTFIDPAVGRVIVRLVSKGRRDHDGPFGLTVQEQRVAVLLTDRMTNREIGEQLAISEETVKDHVARAIAKLGAGDRYEAAEIVRREGITEPY